MSVQFGDRVSYSIPGYGADRGYAGEGVIIGLHGTYPDIVCVATEQAVGMTIGEGLCVKKGDDLPAARRFRERYETQCPGFLAPQTLDDEVSRETSAPV